MNNYPITIKNLINQVSNELFIAKVNDTLYLVSDYHLGDENFEYGIYDTCKVGNSKDLEIPECFINDNFNFLQYDDMPNHYGMSKKEIKMITKHNWCDWADKALELGYKEFYETEKDICNRLKGNLKLDEFSEEELKLFEDIDDFTKQCIKNFEEEQEW